MSTSSSNGSDIVSCGSAKCRKISETYSKANLPHGYLQIATIPSGALNISVRHLGHSGNRLGKQRKIQINTLACDVIVCQRKNRKIPLSVTRESSNVGRDAQLRRISKN